MEATVWVNGYCATVKGSPEEIAQFLSKLPSLYNITYPTPTLTPSMPIEPITVQPVVPPVDLTPKIDWQKAMEEWRRTHRPGDPYFPPKTVFID